jgi:hypothetical protein
VTDLPRKTATGLQAAGNSALLKSMPVKSKTKPMRQALFYYSGE